MKQYFSFFKVHIDYLYRFYQLRRKYGEKLMSELSSHQQKFTPYQQKRIKLYMDVGFYVNDCLATLRGRQMSRKEIEDTLYLSVLTPLMDDLTDSHNLSSEEILEQLHQQVHENSSPFQQVNYLYQHIKKRNEQQLFDNTFRAALSSQDDSLQQLGNSIVEPEALLLITRNKGSLWTVLFRLLLSSPLRKGEREAIESFGELIQLTNDMFDVYKDLQNGQQTCFTNTQDLRQLQELCGNRLEEIMLRFSSLSAEKKYFKKFVDKLLILAALNKVCLEQLRRCQDQNGGVFSPNTYSRKQLVIDMAKWSNQLNYLKHWLQLYKWSRS